MRRDRDCGSRTVRSGAGKEGQGLPSLPKVGNCGCVNRVASSSHLPSRPVWSCPAQQVDASFAFCDPLPVGRLMKLPSLTRHVIRTTRPRVWASPALYHSVDHIRGLVLLTHSVHALPNAACSWMLCAVGAERVHTARSSAWRGQSNRAARKAAAWSCGSKRGQR